MAAIATLVENARFAGVSRPEEASASGVTDQLVPTDGNRQIMPILRL
jgi:hypothetical protein